jgi:hypothetical protein
VQALGVVASGGQELGGDVGPDPAQADQGGRGLGGELGDGALQALALGVEELDPSGELAQGEACLGLDHVVGRAQAPCPLQLDAEGERSQTLPQRLGSADQQRLELVDGPSSVLHRPVVDDLQGPERLDQAVLGLGCAGGPSRQHRPSGGLGVGGVGLALEAPSLAVRAIDLDDLDAFTAQVASETGTQEPVDSTPTASTGPKASSQATIAV